MERQELGDGFRLKDARGELTWRKVAANVVLIQIKGHAAAAMVEPIDTVTSKLLAQQARLHVFIDAEEIGTYDTEFRVWSTNLVLRLKHQVQNYVLIKSSLAKMGVSLAKLLVGDALESLNGRPEFEARMRQLIAAARTGVAGPTKQGPLPHPA